MKKMLLVSSALAALMVFANVANAECDGVYGAVRAGIVKHDADKLQGDLDDRRFMMSGAIGYRYTYFRTELEYVWRKYNRETVPPPFEEKTILKSYSYMWNLYYDIMPYNWWTPYVGAGIGFTKTKYLDRNAYVVSEKWNTTKFTWALGGGLSLKVTNRLNFDAGYRYYNFGEPHRYDVKAQEIYGGIRYVF